MPAVVPLQELDPDRIRPNPDNPRLVFREQEMTQLMDSIREVGVKVPVSVYEDGGRYVLLDGERRWRCTQRLNMPRIPAIIQPKPSKLENLLMMFNIHNVRVDWDLMPMALKLGEVRDMLTAAGKATDVGALAAITGVTRPTVQRALDMLDLPKKYQKMLLKEAAKPRNEQRIKPDLFIEIYKSMRTVERYTPEVFEKVTQPRYVDAMVKKYRSGVVDNVVAYRSVTKIARAEKAGVERDQAIPVLVQLVQNPKYSIEQAFQDTVEAAYTQRSLASKLRSIIQTLSEFRSARNLSADALSALTGLRAEIDRLLGRGG